MKSIHTQHIRSGTYENDQKEKVCDYIGNLQTTKQQGYTVFITEFDNSKTAQQRKYYFGVIVPEFMKWQGCTAKEADQVLKNELLPPKTNTILNKVVETRPSISDMKLSEMANYIDSTINFMGSWGIAVPHPPYKHVDENPNSSIN